MTEPTRRTLLASALATVAASPTAPALAQAWPAKPLRLVVPFAAGAGISDIIARLVGQQLGTVLGQQVVVDNRPGAGGNVGGEIVAKAAPDGYTLLMGSVSMIVNANLYAHMPFDALADFVAVTTLATNPLIVVVHPSVPAKSLAELIRLARNDPGKLNYGSGGVGSTPFLATELLKAATGIQLTHVPYKGGAPALADLVAGQLSMMIENMPGTMPFVKDGKLRALAITSRRRSPLAPDLPTVIEAGVPDYEMMGWNALFLPKGTPVEIAERLHAATTRVLAFPEVRQRLSDIGADPGGEPPAALAAFTKAEAARWTKVIKDLGIKPE